MGAWILYYLLKEASGNEMEGEGKRTRKKDRKGRKGVHKHPVAGV